MTDGARPSIRLATEAEVGGVENAACALALAAADGSAVATCCVERASGRVRLDASVSATHPDLVELVRASVAAAIQDTSLAALFARVPSDAPERIELFRAAGFVGPRWLGLEAGGPCFELTLPLVAWRKHGTETPNYVVACRTPWLWPVLEARRAHFPGKLVLARSTEELSALDLDALAPRYVFFPHWSAKVPSAVFETHECVCFHGTEVPFGRGGSPIQNLVSRGLSDSVLTALRMEAELDAGPVYGRRAYSLQGSATDIFAAISKLTVEMMLEIALAEPSPEPQTGPVTPFRRRTPAQSDLALARPTLGAWYDLIRMLDADGYPHAFLDVGDMRLELRRARLDSDRIVADVVITERSEKT